MPLAPVIPIKAALAVEESPKSVYEQPIMDPSRFCIPKDMVWEFHPVREKLIPSQTDSTTRDRALLTSLLLFGDANVVNFAAGGGRNVGGVRLNQVGTMPLTDQVQMIGIGPEPIFKELVAVFLIHDGA
jgi:hypothetical protein